MTRIDLGSVTCPSGILVILDPGYMRYWSGRNDPKPPVDEFEDPKTKALVATSADYVIAGRDAERVARLADFQQLEFIYDIPSAGVEKIAGRIAALAAEHGLDAHLEREPRRISHRERAQRAADRGGGDFVMEGPWVAVVGGLPHGPLNVRGQRQDYGGHVGSRWTEVSVQVSQNSRESSTQVGYFAVDYGLALIADVDALAAWRHWRPLDSRFDVAFWGRDAEHAARELAAGQLSQGWGWQNITVDEVKDLLRQVETWRQLNPDRKVVFEPRPHSHYHQILEPIRSSPNEVGELELSGARLLGLSTSWGDGIFAVWVDRDAHGRVVAIRLELGNEKRRQLMEQVWEKGTETG